MISTGNDYLDRITGGYKLGDNVVWQVADGVPVKHFIRDFYLRAHEKLGPVIYINFNYSPQTIFNRYEYLFRNKKTVLVDAFTNGKGNRDTVFSDFYVEHTEDNFILVDDPRDTMAFLEVMNRIEERHRTGSFYIFDSLTGMNELWVNEKHVLDFFAFTCPKLYDLNTLAYWMLEEKAHSREFLAGLNHITQVVFSLRSSDSDCFEFRINKLEDRASFHNGENKFFKISGDSIHFLEKKPDIQVQVGTAIRELRKDMKLTQAELASQLGITPGAVSQIENDLITPSLQTVFQLARLFNTPVDEILSISRKKQSGYFLTRKGFPVSVPHRDITVKRLLDAASAHLKPFSVTIPPGKSIAGPLMLHKGSEFIFLTGGSMTLLLNGEKISMEKGDSLFVETAFIEGITTGREGSEFMYLLI